MTIEQTAIEKKEIGAMDEARLHIGGAWTDGAETVDLLDKYDGARLATVHQASHEQVDAALADLAVAQPDLTPAPYERGLVLDAASRLLLERRADFVAAIIADTGFTVTDADREVDRGAQTLRLCAEEARMLVGEMVPMHGAPGQAGRIGYTVRRPLGVVAAITPFNSPLNTVIHKVGPALAAGNAVILKPASASPLTSNLLVELLVDAGLPARLIALVHGGGSTVGEWLLASPVPAFYAFTGSTEVGRWVREKAGLRRNQLELGSMSTTFVMADADLDKAVPLCVNASFRKAGQVCTSVQRLYVESSIYEEFVTRLVEDTRQRQVGDPRDPKTFVGPVISPKEAARLESWIVEAREAGATVRLGGARDGNVIQPTILTDVPATVSLACREVFGPIVSVVPFDSFDDAVADANDTPYGLASGIFTRDLGTALAAAERLHMGSVHINETASSRIDLMPYGAAKESGVGLEGPHYAIREMSEERLITITRP